MGIDTTSLWLICVSVCAPIAAVVGFAIQLRTVKKLRLENEKLFLEIESLRKKQKESGNRLITPTTDEVIKYNDALFSRKWTGVNPGPDDGPIENNRPFITAAIQFAFYFLVATFIFYVFFDIYRLMVWLWSLF